MTDPDATQPIEPQGTDDGAGGGGTAAAVIAALVVLVGLIIGAIFLFGGGDDDEVAEETTTTAIEEETTTTVEDEETTTTVEDTTTTVEETTTTVEETTTTTEPAPDGLPADEEAVTVWPWVVDPVRFDDPAVAALDFADFLGIADPTVGQVIQGDARSAEVEIFSGTIPSPTIVSVRLMSDDTWWVLGTFSANLVLDQPAADATVSSTIELIGESTAFEATVLVDVYLVGNAQPIFAGFFTGGGSMGEFAPFQTTIEIDPQAMPAEPTRGFVVLSTDDPSNGGRAEATVIRLVLAP